jgi:TolA-binding protein
MKNQMTSAGINAAGILLVLLSLLCLAKPVQKDDWRIRENLVTRLSGEWYKINVLTRDLSSVNDIIQGMRDIELFPPEATRCSEESLVSFDKKLDICEKKYLVLQKRVAALQAPLADGCAILRQMVVGQPVEDMFGVLDNDDMARIADMMSIKHHVDSLWNNLDTLLTSLGNRMQVALPQRDAGGQGFEAEFFEILSANLGEKTQLYYRMLDAIKDELVERGSGDAVEQMYRIEAHRAVEYLKENRTDAAVRVLHALAGRYTAPQQRDELYYLLVKSYFMQAAYDSVLSAQEGVSDTARFGSDLVLFRVQSQYALGRFDTLWRWGQTFPFAMLAGSHRNCCLWAVLESGLALGKTERFGDLASLVIKDSSYALHVMHALARSYVQAGDLQNAVQVLESALKFKPVLDLDKKAYRRIQLTAAQTQFEKGNFDKALSQFFGLLNSEDEQVFAEALFGISWCYIKLGMYQKAELSLRKLINQMPNSPLAVRALLIMGQRSLNKVQYEWEKLTFLANAENKLDLLQKRLSEKMADSATLASRASRDRLGRTTSRIEELLTRFKNEKREDARSLGAMYDEALRLSTLIQKFYATGSFQEITFSEKREMLLHRLDSLVLGIKTGANTANASGNAAGAFAEAAVSVAGIKQLVFKGRVFGARAQIDRFRWEKEYLDWQKGPAKREIDALDREAAKAKDSIVISRLVAKKAAQNRIMDSLVKEGDMIHERWYARLTKTCEDLTSLPLDSNDEMYLRYHDAELHYAHENERYSRAYSAFEIAIAAYDSLMTLFRDGKIVAMPSKPPEPVLAHDSSMQQYRYIMQKYPKSDLAYAVRYSLAWCFNDIGRFDSAVAQMDSVALRYPTCQYAPQAWMYIGEYMFERTKLDVALKAYQSVLTYPESEWFDKALYKLAWAQYRLSNPEKAISSFLALVDLGDKAPNGKSLLEKESIDYIAISFSETDITGEKGLERATNFVRRFGDPAKGTDIMHRLAVIYKEQGRFDMAQKTYRTLLKMYPDYKQSPLIESELLAVMEKSGSVEETNIRNQEFFGKYNRNGDWAKAQTDKGVVAKADSLSQNHLYDAAVSYHQLALQKSDTMLYQTAAEGYGDFIKNYPASAHAGECHYNLAEIQFSLGNYQRAAEEYMAVSRRYPDPKYKETAAWNAIVASQNMLKKEGPRQK